MFVLLRCYALYWTVIVTKEFFDLSTMTSLALAVLLTTSLCIAVSNGVSWSVSSPSLDGIANCWTSWSSFELIHSWLHHVPLLLPGLLILLLIWLVVGSGKLWINPWDWLLAKYYAARGSLLIIWWRSTTKKRIRRKLKLFYYCVEHIMHVCT